MRLNDETAMSNLDPIPYFDAQLRAILQRVRPSPWPGASSNWSRPSCFVMKYLERAGKIGHLGVSKVSASELARARAAAEIVSVQNAYNLRGR